MMAAMLGKGGGERFRIGYVAGLAYYLTWLYWLLLIPYRWHGIPLGPAAGWLSLSAYLASYPATWVWLLSSESKVQSLRSKVQGPESGEGRGSREVAGPMWAGSGGDLWGGWAKRALWAFCGAAAWVALEMVLTRLFSGFPWDLLGTSQY